jgi:hypothetical protein
MIRIWVLSFRITRVSVCKFQIDKLDINVNLDKSLKYLFENNEVRVSDGTGNKRIYV